MGVGLSGRVDLSGRVGLRKWESRAALPQVLSGTEDNNERSPAAGRTPVALAHDGTKVL